MEVVSRDLVALMREARGFRSLAEHTARFCRRCGLESGVADAILGDLRRLEDRGFFEGLEEARAFADAERPAGVIGAVAIPLSRPPALAAPVVAEAIEVLGRREQAVELVVVDGSSGAVLADDYRAMLRRTPKPAQVALRFASGEEKRSYAITLARRSGVEPKVAELALFGAGNAAFRAGASRNTLQLDLAGERYVTVDDDTRFRLAPSPSMSGGLEVASLDDPTDFWFFGSDEAAARFSPTDPEVLAVHEPILGAAAASLPGASEADVENASPRLLRRLREAPMIVRVTACGVAGDSGMRSTSYYLGREGETRERLFADYQRARTTRSVFRASRRTVVTDSPFLMLPCAGIDARVLLPPSLPVYRNADGLFGLTVTACCPGALIAHLPHAVVHLPKPRRLSHDRMFEPFDQVRVSDLIALATRSASLGPAQETEARLARLGAHLRELAGRPRQELLERFLLLRAQQLARLTARLTDLLERHRPAPSAWVKDVEHALRIMEQTAPQPSSVIPQDVDSEEPFGDFADLLGRYGELLQAWPALDAAARDLRAEGTRLSVPV